jgi:hypothetical protein
MIWPKILALVVVLALLGGLIYLGGKIPPNNSSGDS